MTDGFSKVNNEKTRATEVMKKHNETIQSSMVQNQKLIAEVFDEMK